MRAKIDKSLFSGMLTAPPSKSYTIRALFAAALADGISHVLNPLISDDTEAAADVLSQLGARIIRQPGNWIVSGGHLKPPSHPLHCRQSAATLRFLVPLCAILEGESNITFAPGLARRPLTPLLDALAQLGIGTKMTDTGLTVRGGRVRASQVSLPGNVSSQFISGLLLAAPLSPEGLTITLTTPAESKDYLRMTVDCLRQFGISVKNNAGLTQFHAGHQVYQPVDYIVEGDWSSVSYFLGLGAISGSMTIAGLKPDSFQADRFMLNCLRRMGAAVDVTGSSVTVKPSALRASEIDLNEAIDLLPTIACLAAVAEGTSVITGLERARFKESDRVSVVAENLKHMGIEIIEESNRMTITGGKAHGAVINSHNDHRIAMAFAMLAVTCGHTVIEAAECVEKTYPCFWQDFARAGGKVNLGE